MTATVIVLLVGSLSLRTEIGIGGDYTSQRYSFETWDSLSPEWREEDTLDIETEARTGVSLRLAWEAGKHRLDAGNAADISTRSLRDRLNLGYELELTPTLTVRAGNETELRHYHKWMSATEDSLYRGRDYWSNLGHLELRIRPGSSLRLNLSESFELLRYAEPDSYYYGFNLNRIRLTGWWEPGLFTALNFGAGWTRRRAAADAVRDYDEYALQAGAEHLFAAGPGLTVDNELRRRVYRDHAGRSGWEEALTLGSGYDLGPVRLLLENAARWVLYDSSSAVYPSQFENGLGLSAEFGPGTDIRLRAGPRFDIGLGIAGYREDDYRELSFLAGADLFRTDRLWLNLENRVGRRRYLNADTTWQSERFNFNELSLFGSWTFLRGRAGELRLEAMAGITPEWHARATDNFLLAVYSLDLKYGF